MIPPFPSNKNVLLIYRDGRMLPTFRKWDKPVYRTAELYPIAHNTYDRGVHLIPDMTPILLREFRFVGEAGPYAVYAEV